MNTYENLNKASYAPVRTWAQLWVATLIGMVAAIAVAAQTVHALEMSIAAVFGMKSAMLFASGVIQGVLIGGAQWVALRDNVPRTAWIDWMLVVAAGSAVAWVSMIAGARVLAGSLGSEGAVSWMLTMWIAAATAFALGALFAAAQWSVLVAYFRGGVRFIVAGAFGWCLPALLIVLSISKVRFDALSPAATVLGLIGVFAGAMIGSAIIATAFRSILRRPR